MSWCVYEHICPDGKRYIGATGKNPPERRWRNGFGYETHPMFFKEIVKQGWQNITHNILYNELSENEAKEIEEREIRKAANIYGDLLLNRNCNPRPKKPQQNCSNYKITPENIEKYASEFIGLGDDWLIPYKALTGYYPFTSELAYGHMDLIYYDSINGSIKESRYRIPYPDSITSFYELWDFLRQGAVGEWVERS